MTDLEFRAMLSLKGIRYASGIWHGDRARWLCRLCQSDALWKLTFAERVDLWFLIWHYRAQVRDLELIAFANQEVNGQQALRFA